MSDVSSGMLDRNYFGERKMTIECINKDITTVRMGIVAHGVNCQGVMGSGVAKAIRDAWPVVYTAYKGMPTGKTMLGVAHLINVDCANLYVANCYTQIFYGKGGRFASPEAIKTSLCRVYEWADYYDLPIYLPKIGAGLGGLSWETEVLPIFEQLDNTWERVDTLVCVWGE